uniref:Head-to-tail stopper n=1 Tax=Micrococcus phage Kurnik TaxID=3092208 RepID=A0AAU6R6H5_9CAUD
MATFHVHWIARGPLSNGGMEIVEATTEREAKREAHRRFGEWGSHNAITAVTRVPEKAFLIIARSRTGRPTLQHKLTEAYGDETVCGLDVTLWSRAYTTTPIPQIICKKCGKQVKTDG